MVSMEGNGNGNLGDVIEQKKKGWKDKTKYGEEVEVQISKGRKKINI